MPKTTYLANKVNDKVHRGVDFTVSARYIALFTAMPNAGGGGTEVTGGAYARQAATFGSASANGQIANTVDIAFPQATADWGNVVGWAEFDAATGGNMLHYDNIRDGSNNPITKNITIGDQFMCPTGSLVITEA